MNAPDVPILIVDKALTATELRRLETELQAAADAGAVAVLVAVDRFELTEADALAGLVDLLEHPPAGLPVAVLLTGRIPRELAARLLALDLQAFATPRAEVETAVVARTITGTELSLTGLAELVRSPRHAAERLRAMATALAGRWPKTFQATVKQRLRMSQSHARRSVTTISRLTFTAKTCDTPLTSRQRAWYASTVLLRMAGSAGPEST